MTGVTAVKPVFNRTTQKYEVEVVKDADPILCHSGYLVYDDPLKTRNAILAAQLLQSWTPKKVNAVLAHLNAAIEERGLE